MRKLSSKLALGVLAAICSLSASAMANTLQPILISVSAPVAGVYTYTYDVQLTPGNSLQNAAATPVNFPSSLVIVDFGVVSSASVLGSVSGLQSPNITTSANWIVTTPTTGSGLPNDASTVGFLGLKSSNGPVISVPETGLSNVVLQYTGGFVASNPSDQRSAFQLQIKTTLAPGPILNSLSVDGNPNTGVQQVESYSVSTTAVPVPAAAWAGLSTLGGLGVLGAFRKRRTA